MMIHKTSIVVAVILCCLLTGCVQTNYMSQRHYMLQVVTPTAPAKQSCPLHIARPQVVAPFAQTNFIYRTTTNQYLTDYYNGFMAPLTDQLEPLIAAYFCQASYPKLVQGESYQLRSEVSEFYADYRDRAQPKAVVQMHFQLVKLTDGQKTLSLDRSFSQAVPLQAKNTESLLRAWNQGVLKILLQASSQK